MANLTDDMPLTAQMVSYAFNIWFAIELLLKIYLHRLFFFISGQWKMNFLDFFLVAYSLLEHVAMRLSFLRILRMFKMAKIVRMLKALTAVHDLRIMLDCLLGSFFGLFWALVLIGVLMYIYALIFVQALTEYVIENRDEISKTQQDDITTYFGSVVAGLLTVYKCLTGGMDWGDIYILVQPAGVIAGPACLLMVAFFTISVWNIITSVFIEKAMQMARPTLRELVKEHKAQSKQDAAEVEELIRKLDHDRKGYVSKAEFKDICKDGEIQEFLAVRDLDIQNVKDIDGFYEMVSDVDPSQVDANQVSVPGLVSILLHLKGSAKSLDLHKKLFEVGITQQSLLTSMQLLQAELRQDRGMSSRPRTDFRI
jgi:hypothetical protein